jgi:myosin-1
MAKVLYDFAGTKENELSIKAGQLIEIVQKENNGKFLGPNNSLFYHADRLVSGWWLAKTPGGQAWVPAAYVEEQEAAPVPAPRPPPPPPAANGAAARAKPAAPQPPAKRPAAGRKPVALQQGRDSGMSMNGSDSSRSNTPTPSLAGSLADALLARKNAMAKKDDDDDW